MAASSRCWRPRTGASSSPARRTSPWTSRRCCGGPWTSTAGAAGGDPSSPRERSLTGRRCGRCSRRPAAGPRRRCAVPETPSAEPLVATLRPRVVGRTIRAAPLRSVSLLKSVDPPVTAIQGATIQDVRRRGKLALFDLSGALVMIIHPKRDGAEDLRLMELGPKKRAGLYVRRAAEVEQTEPVGGLGVEPLDATFTPEALAAMLDQARMQLKRFLGTQRYLAGIGNAYGDEILWEARLSPFAPTRSLKGEERSHLHAAIREVLQRSIAEHRAHFGDDLPMREPVDLLRVHRRAGEACPRCGTPVAAVYFSEKVTYYCPGCQTGGKVYADRRLSRLLK